MVLGILAAMPSELDPVHAKMQVQSQEEALGFMLTYGVLEGLDVVTVCSGIGNVNGALAAQMLIARGGATAVVNVGVAGALSHELDYADMVISRDAVYHDFQARFLENNYPFFKTAVFAADRALVEAAAAACAECMKDGTYKLGRIVSGQSFVSDADLKERLHTTDGGDCVEMEGAGVAHACALSKTPFVILRAISDRRDDVGDQGEMKFEEFLEMACARSAIVLVHMARHLSSKNC